MKRMVLTLGLTCFLATSVSAQGNIYLSFSAEERIDSIEVEELEAFDFYLVVDLNGAADNFYGYETSISVDSGILFSSMSLNPSTSLNVGSGGLVDGGLNLIVGLGECVSDEVYAVASFRGLVLDESDARFIGLGPSTPSSFNSGEPAWVDCDSGFYTFDDWEAQQLKVASAPVSTEPSSWGKVKALY